MCPCGHVTSSSPQLYLPVMRHTTVGGMDGKSTTRFAAQGCISLRYCHTAILPYCHTATTIIPRHSRSVLQGIFSQINPVHLADASAILQRPLSYRVRHIGTDPAMSTPGRCNSSTANITCNSHMAWLLTTVLSDWAGQQTRVTPPFSPCAHAAMSPAAAPSSIYQLCATRPLEAWMVNQPLGSPHRAAYLYGTVLYR